METCTICSQPAILMHEYGGIPLKVIRCKNCIVRFPPKNFSWDFLEYAYKTRQSLNYHQWVLVRQSDKSNVWKCPTCHPVLTNPYRLGYPTNVGCVRGIRKSFKGIIYISSKIIKDAICPVCKGEVEIVRAKNILQQRPKGSFPFICRTCNPKKA